jgi:predicted Zn finger-like uncharacterized protein
MRITCPACTTSYTIADDKIGANGRSVRCASCGNKWHVSLDDEQEEAEVAAFDAGATDDFTPASEGADPFDAVGGDDASEPVPISSLRLNVGEPAKPVVEPARTEPADDASNVDLDAQLAEINKRKDIESFAKKPKIKVSKKKPQKVRKPFKFDLDRFLVRARPVLGAFVLLMSFGVIGLAVTLRTSVVAAFPSLASLYQLAGMPVNLRGLDFVNLKMMREVDNSQPVLVVEGELLNPSAVDRDVPGIRFSLRGDDAQEIYAWSIEPKTTLLTPGATMRFRTRLASPPEQAADIQVRMIDRRNRQTASNE